ncbi:MAG: phosphoribosylformylglycinamidine synthase, partial [Clostridia bacterium]|nr:phosphoribosylformylglycinamidine synthase [Clostridia bacterium]
TEIEPFGGAATCIGGAIRDPLSGMAYVYGAMRVTGAADPLAPMSRTMKGKLPQRKIVTTAAAGYSSYGNQIGLATGIVDELYHPGYAAKRMEIGAVIGAAPAKNVRRERPVSGDVVILLGGATGRDGCGGATGSSKSHTVESLSTCGAEVQKGNAPEERKLQRLFRDPAASLLIKRCNDFGAGGVSVAVGELADGLDIDLSAVPKKYEGLDGTELAISESQERMAVVVAAEDAEAFLALAAKENLRAVPIARVTDTGRLRMRCEGRLIVDISREFLDSNGAEKHADAIVGAPSRPAVRKAGDFRHLLLDIASDLNFCSKRGLAETFDSTIGAGSVMMPFGGKNQLTPVQAMVQKIPVAEGSTDDCSFMSWGFDPYLTEESPFRGSYLAVVHSLSKLVASGAPEGNVYLSFQEYFERLGKDPRSWGKPLAALLGAFRAQTELEAAAIGGKDSMSGSFEKIHVPPTLVSFAVTVGKTSDARSPEFKKAGSSVFLICPEYRENGTPEPDSLKKVFDRVRRGLADGRFLSAWATGSGGVAEGVVKCCFGNGFGFDFDAGVPVSRLAAPLIGSFIVETETRCDGAEFVGRTSDSPVFTRGCESLQASTLFGVYEDKLEPVYRCNSVSPVPGVRDVSYSGAQRARAHGVILSKPRVLIPVFPGTNCEYDSARAVSAAGAEPVVRIVRNLTPDAIRESTEEIARELASSQALFIPGGFSGGDEPEGSGKFITSFFRNETLRREVENLLDSRGGLILGICNGFQALVKLGLVPYGKIVDPDPEAPTLTFNTIGRHQSRIVMTRVASKLSPWLSRAELGGVYSVPVSHGEGRFFASPSVVAELEKNGQIATQYAGPDGRASGDVRYNPNGSVLAIEGITSPDGRVFGKMGHSERTGSDLYRNVPGNYDIGLFRSAVDYFKSL